MTDQTQDISLGPVGAFGNAANLDRPEEHELSELLHHSAPDSGETPEEALLGAGADASSIHSSESASTVAKPPGNPKKKWTRESQLSGASVALLLILALAALVVWLPLASHRNVAVFGLDPGIIGGRFTQPQAKTIDFICSAILAPLVLFVYQKVWFETMQVLTINETVPRGPVSLAVLAEVSSTDAGSYSPLKFLKFARSKSWSVILYGVMVLVAAGTSSLLQNFIAYQAYTGDDGMITAHVNYISNPIMETVPSYPQAGMSFHTYGFSSSQQAAFTSQMVSMLYPMSFQDSKQLLSGTYYFGLNATKNSLSAVDSSVSHLFNVPGYRLSINCTSNPPMQGNMTYTTEAPMKASQLEDTKIMFLTDPDMFFNESDTTGNFSVEPSFLSNWTARFRGSDFALTQGTGNVWPLLAFPNSLNQSNNDSQVYIAFLSPFIAQNNSITSDGINGSLVVTLQEMQLLDDTTGQPEPKAFTSWGIECKVPREQGTHNLMRQGNGSWIIESSSFNGQIDYPALQLGFWDVDLNFQAINSNMAGFGPAVFSIADRNSVNEAVSDQVLGPQRPDLTTAMLNALYMIGETERIANEVVMFNTTCCSADNSFTIEGKSTATFYQITYVPLILLGGIFFAAVTSCIPLILYIYNSRARPLSFRTWRQVSVLRLIVDAKEVLLESREVESTQALLSNKSIRRWAKDLKVRYLSQYDEAGNEGIKLKKL